MKFEEKAALFGMSKKHDVYEKVVDGYHMQLIQKTYPGTIRKLPCVVFVFNRTLEKADISAIQKAAGISKGMVQFETVGKSKNTMTMFANFGKRNFQKFNHRLNKMIAAFRSQGLVSLEGCPFCENEEDTDGYRVIDGIAIDVHEACVASFVSETSSQIESEVTSKGMLKSLVYAFVGAIFGAVPTFIVLFAFNIFSAWLFMIIPFVAFYFYKFGKGPKTIPALVLVAVFSLIPVPALVTYSYHSFAMQFGFTLFEALEIDAEFASSFFYDLGISFVFSLIGIAVAWGYFYRNSTAASKRKLEFFKK